MNRVLLEDFVDQYYENLYRFALSLTNNEAEASDLTQQTFLLLASKGGQIKDHGKAKSWLFTCLRREYYSLRKQDGRYESFDHEENDFRVGELEAPDNVELEVLKKADARIVIECLNEISEVFRVPLALFYFEDFSYREIAKILDVPEGTVMSRLSRGRTGLRSRIQHRLNTDSLPGNVLPMNRDHKKAE